MFDYFETERGKYLIFNDKFYFYPREFPNMKFEISRREYIRAYRTK